MIAIMFALLTFAPLPPQARVARPTGGHVIGYGGRR